MEYGAVVVWWAVLVLLGAVGAPIAASLMRPLPDRGVALALPTALAVLFVPVYWLGQLRYGPVTVAAGALVLAGLSAVLARRGPGLDRRRFVEWAAVFTLAFLLLVAVRAVDPSVLPGGGEKFLDYGLLRSLLRAQQLPPEDVWFAGEPVAYYYGGHLLAASLATLTGTPARYAYNLALAGVYAALVAGAYGVAGSLAAERGRSYQLGGGFGAFLVGIASNVVPLLQAAVWVLPATVAAPVTEAVAARTAIPAGRLPLSAFHYWTASRVVPVTVNEFPLFAFLNGDLHAHMSSQPFLLLVAGLGFAYYLTPAGAVRRRRLLVFGAVPVVAGLLVVVNTWSLPAAAGLAGLAVLFAGAPPRDLLPDRLAGRLPPPGGVPGEIVRMGVATAVVLAVALLAALPSLPFVLGRLTATSGQSLGLGLLPDRTGLLAFLLVHGWFLLVYGLYFALRSSPSGVPSDGAIAATVVVVFVGLLGGAAAVAVLVPPLGLAWYLLRRSGDVGFETVLFVAGAGLVLVVEFLFVDEQAGPGRFNTVFKTYSQVWVLWGAGAGAALAALLPGSGSLLSSSGDRPPRRTLASVGLAALLVASASIYGVVALGAHLTDAPEPTLDATTYAQRYHAGEWEAIQYFDGAAGTPVVVTAPGCVCNPDGVAHPYGWTNAPSTFTGLPTVAGWHHVVGYRGNEPYLRRVDDVRAIYTGSPDQRERLLRRYDVRYVYVGPNERALYDDVSVGGSRGLEVVFRNDAVTIYEVAALGG